MVLAIATAAHEAPAHPRCFTRARRFALVRRLVGGHVEAEEHLAAAVAAAVRAAGGAAPTAPPAGTPAPRPRFAADTLGGESAGDGAVSRDNGMASAGGTGSGGTEPGVLGPRGSTLSGEGQESRRAEAGAGGAGVRFGGVGGGESEAGAVAGAAAAAVVAGKAAAAMTAAGGASGGGRVAASSGGGGAGGGGGGSSSAAWRRKPGALASLALLQAEHGKVVQVG